MHDRIEEGETMREATMALCSIPTQHVLDAPMD